MRSDDPSPWASESGGMEETQESTAELWAMAEENNRRRLIQERTEAALWERFAPRLTANGGLIR